MPKLGYLLPTRERVMENHHETGSLLAHQVATLDRIAEGRLILGIGIASDMPAIRLEFEATGVPFDKRVGRMNEAIRLCKALWTGKPVDWNKLWTVKQGTVGPTPHRPGGPPIWFGGGLPAGRERTGKLYDGWFPNLPTPEEYPVQLAEVRAAAKAAGRDPQAITGAMYLTLAIDDDTRRADAKIDSYLAHYYGVPAAQMRARQRSFAGPVSGAAAWIKSYADAGATHIMLRFAGEHERHLEQGAKIKQELGWA